MSEANSYFFLYVRVLMDISYVLKPQAWAVGECKYMCLTLYAYKWLSDGGAIGRFKEIPH